ncbi:MAG: T9SS type A sorting domain-containing protein [Bacteroidetes bacterium]|nr:T9SS type A sorting domain-containing protein [Bacteroidota bacterium]
MNKFKLIPVLLAFLFISCFEAKAQTTLVAGDLVFTGFNCDLVNDNFSFVLLKNITVNTTIRFTDFGWLTTNQFGSGLASESEMVFVSGAAINAGTEIVITGAAAPTATFSGGGSAGTVTFTTGTLAGVAALTTLSLSTGGDQIFAYQGSFASPTFIAGIHFNTLTIAGGDGINTGDANWDGNYGTSPSNGSSSSKPSALTTAVSAVWMGTVSATSPFNVEPENGIYNCTGTLNSVANVQAAVNNKANWNVNDATAYTLPSNCTFLSTPAPTFTTNPSASTACAGLSVSYNAVASGASITFQWQEATDAAFTTGLVTLSNSGIYSISSTATTSALTISDNTTVNGRFYRCVASNLGGTVNSTGAGLTASANNLPTGNTSVTQTAGTGNNSIYFASACRLIAKVLPSGATPVSGNITTEVWVEGAVGTVGPIPFGQRHYQVTPAGGSTGTVTLYFTQTEFDNFNAHPGSILNVPTGPADNAGKANLRIGKIAGSSGDGSGLPGSYTGVRSVIDPIDANIVWNATNSRWEVTFDVSGFSGFFLQSTNTPLPVKLVSFTGKLNSDKTVTLNWKVAEQQDISTYTIERSNDGVLYSPVNAVNATNTDNYTILDPMPGTGKNYYRLKITENTGKVIFSNVIIINLKAGIVISLYPNPVSNKLTIQQFGTIQNKTAILADQQGKVLQQVKLTSLQQTVNMERYAAGIYMLKLEDGTTFKIVKE